jgi:hypothetical protein
MLSVVKITGGHDAGKKSRGIDVDEHGQYSDRA